MTKFQTKVLGAYERHERSKSAFAAHGEWELTQDPSYRWTKGNLRVQCASHGWVLVEKLEDGWPLASEIRKGKGVIAKTNGDPEELLAYV